MRSCRSRACGCLLLALLLLGAGAFWGWRRLSWHPPAPPPPTPARVREARRQTAALERKIARLAPRPRPRRPRKAAPAPKSSSPATFTLTLTEEELNAALQPGSDAANALQGFGIRAPTVELAANRLTLHTYFRQGDAELYITLEGTPYLNRQRKPRLRIQDVHVGQVPAPAPLRRSLQSDLHLALRQLDKQIAAHLDQISVAPGRLVIHGHGASVSDKVMGVRR